jgi:DNA primase
MSITDEIKARLDIVDLIGGYVQLKKAGRNYKGLCPFHSERTPSFIVFPESQQWRCFGACGEGGDIFTFLMKREGWSFSDTLRYLAEKAGVDLQPSSPQQAQASEKYEKLRGLLLEAAQFFHKHLLEAPDATHARSYIEKRGLNAGTIEQFLLGYAPAGWETTLNYLQGLGYQREELIEAGLLVVKDDGGVYDRFRDRLMIPIRDARGNIVGFGARGLSKDAVPKYLNSPQSPLFDKSKLLFGLSDARRSIREGETAIIVEGYMDVMQAHQAGYTNVVAQMGTALTEAQMRLLARYAKHLILALDPDTAGQIATDRGRQVIERVSKEAAEQASQEGKWAFDAVEREYRAKFTAEFDARGMVRYEDRLGFDIRVLVLPEGQDPDDLIRDNPAAWPGLVAGALPVVEYVIQTATANQNLDDPKIKSSIAGQIIPLINEIADPVERSHYRQRLARLLKVDERALFAEEAKGGLAHRPASARKPSLPSQTSDTPPKGKGTLENIFSPDTPREAFCLATLIRYPSLLYRINRILAECLSPEGLIRTRPQLAEMGQWPELDVLEGQVVPGDFTHPEHRVIFIAWQSALAQDELDPLHCLLHSLDPMIRTRLDMWLSQPLDTLLRNVTPVPAQLPEDAVQSEAIVRLLDIRRSRFDERIQELGFLMQDTEEAEDRSTIQQYGYTIVALTAARKRIEQTRERYSLPGRKIHEHSTGARPISGA